VCPFSAQNKHLLSLSNVSFKSQKFECSINLCLYNIDLMGNFIKNDIPSSMPPAHPTSAAGLQPQPSVQKYESSSQGRGALPKHQEPTKEKEADSNHGLLTGIYSIIFQNPSDKKSGDDNNQLMQEVDSYATVSDIMNSLVFSSSNKRRQVIPSDIYQENILNIGQFQYHPDQYKELLAQTH